MGQPLDILTCREVSQKLRLPLSTVYYLTKSGQLPAFQIGRAWRYAREDIENLIVTQGPSRRILVVDDDAVSRMYVSEILTPHKCAVAEADSGEAAMAAVEEKRFDLLFIDIQLPGINGVELIRSLLAHYSLSQIVVITAFPDLAKVNGLLDLGAVTLLRKPLAAHQLLECLERCAPRSRPAAKHNTPRRLPHPK